MSENHCMKKVLLMANKEETVCTDSIQRWSIKICRAEMHVAKETPSASLSSSEQRHFRGTSSGAT